MANPGTYVCNPLCCGTLCVCDRVAVSLWRHSGPHMIAHIRLYLQGRVLRSPIYAA